VSQFTHGSFPIWLASRGSPCCRAPGGGPGAARFFARAYLLELELLLDSLECSEDEELEELDECDELELEELELDGEELELELEFDEREELELDELDGNELELELEDPGSFPEPDPFDSAGSDGPVTVPPVQPTRPPRPTNNVPPESSRRNSRRSSRVFSRCWSRLRLIMRFSLFMWPRPPHRRRLRQLLDGAPLEVQLDAPDHFVRCDHVHATGQRSDDIDALANIAR
jgi:hypothetical protein